MKTQYAQEPKRMKTSLALCALALGATLGCASSPTTPAAPTADSNAAVPVEQVSTTVSADGNTVTTDDGDKLICRSIASTGTRLKERVCKTKSQIEAERERAKEATDAFQTKGGIQEEHGS
jgi:hypothetical protein